MNTTRGFTLIEMLAALVVLALCSSVLLGAFGETTRALQKVSRSDRLTLAAQSILDEIDASPLAVGTRRGRWDSLQWVLNVSLTPSLASSATLYRLDLTVTDGTHPLHLSTLRAHVSEGAQ